MSGPRKEPESARRSGSEPSVPPKRRLQHQRTPRPPGRDLKTAREVLKVLRLLEEHGVVDASEVSRRVGKSTATATYLLNSLVAEGFAVRDPSGIPGRYCLVAKSADGNRVAVPDPGVHRLLADALQELYRRTGERSYLALLDSDLIVVVDAVGRQGLARIPGLGPLIRREAHCLAIGKVILAELGFEEWRARTGQADLTSFTPRSITDPVNLCVELETVRQQGFALDRQEFAEATCCVAAPIRDHQGRLVASLGISAPARRFNAAQETLIASVTRVCEEASAAYCDDPTPTTERRR